MHGVGPNVNGAKRVVGEGHQSSVNSEMQRLKTVGEEAIRGFSKLAGDSPFYVPEELIFL